MPCPDLTDSSLLDQIGGEMGLRTLLGAFYFRVLVDPELERFFSTTPLDRLLEHQHRFLSAALEKVTPEMPGLLMQAHGQLVAQQGLNDRHFDAMLDALTGAMRDLGHREPVIRELTGRLEPFRTHVLGNRDAPLQSGKKD